MLSYSLRMATVTHKKLHKMHWGEIFCELERERKTLHVIQG